MRPVSGAAGRREKSLRAASMRECPGQLPHLSMPPTVFTAQQMDGCTCNGNSPIDYTALLIA